MDKKCRHIVNAFTLHAIFCGRHLGAVGQNAGVPYGADLLPCLTSISPPLWRGSYFRAFPAFTPLPYL